MNGIMGAYATSSRFQVRSGRWLLYKGSGFGPILLAALSHWRD